MMIKNYKEEFLTKYIKAKPFIISEEINSDLDTAISLYLKLKNISKYSFLLESAEKDNNKGRYSAIGLLPDLIWECNKNIITIAKEGANYIQENSTNDEIKDSLEKIQTESKIEEFSYLPTISSGLFGYMNYDMVHYFENIPAHQKDELNIPEAKFIRPTIIIVIDNLKDKIMLSLPIYPNDLEGEKVFIQKLALVDKIKKHLTNNIKINLQEQNTDNLNFSSNFSKTEYQDIVAKAKSYIKSGDIFQVLPSRRFKAKFPHSGFALYRSLRTLNPSPFLFYLNFIDFEIIGSSPEIMVRVKDDIVTVRPLAGTRKRGNNAVEDQELAKDLLNDKKEVAEHLMLIDLGRNDVGRVAEKNSIDVNKYMEIEYYSHVMHISSNIDGKIKADKTCLDALIAGFPAGTVSGAPKIRAMEIIAEFESQKRSFYSGCIGYFSAHKKHMDMAIMLRTALLKDKILYAQSGAGIVYDSKPDMEYEETENKAAVIFKAAENAIKFT